MLPTVLLIDGSGVEVKRFVGGKPYATLEKEINKIAVKLQAGSK